MKTDLVRLAAHKVLNGAGCGARSRNTQIHNLVLYQLS